MRKKIISSVLITMITITLFLAAVPAIASDSIIDIGFEDGSLNGFANRGGGEVLTVTTEQARTGSRSLLVTGRSAGWHGAAVRVERDITAGVEYGISAWVRLKTPASAEVLLSTQIGQGSNAQYRTINKNTVSNTTWTQLTDKIIFSEADVASGFITIYIECSTATAEYYIDDVTIGLFDPPKTITVTTADDDPTKESWHGGTHNGYNYSLWSHSRGIATMTLEENDGAFSAEWSNCYSTLFRSGKVFGRGWLGSTQTHTDIGMITVDYSAQYDKRGDTWLSVYGWASHGPLTIEYYIVDSWGTHRPGTYGTLKGTVEIDGGTYEIYEAKDVIIYGEQTDPDFRQYWSIRTEQRDSGRISVTRHFEEWGKLGMMVGLLHEVALTIEAHGSSGYANVTKNVFTIGEPPPPPSELPPLANFKKVRTYTTGYFIDIANPSWATDWIRRAYEYGIISGTTDYSTANTFAPNGSLSGSMALTIAARIHATYKYGSAGDAKIEAFKTEGDQWYDMYVKYCKDEGLIGDQLDNKLTTPVTRAEMVFAWSKLIEAKDMSRQNTVNSLPDVTSATPYRNEIIAFYEAGILTGADNAGTFNPGNNITRAEAATIFMRLIEPGARASGRTFG